MSDWISIYFDEKRGGYHARFRSPDGTDKKRKVPAGILKRANAQPGEQSEKASRAAYRWAVSQTGVLQAQKEEREAEARTLRGIWDLFKRKNPNNIAPITITKYGERAAYLFEWFDESEGMDPASIDRTAAAAFVRSREQTVPRPSSKTVQNEVALLKQLLEWAVEWRDETGVEFTRFTKRPKIEQTETKGHALSVEDIAAVLSAEGKGRRVQDVSRAKRIIVFGIATMLRHTTLYGLRWEWIDAKRGRLKVPASAMKTRQTLDVPLAATAMEIIGPAQESGWVFPSPTGGRTKHVQKTLDGLAREACIQRFTPHDLRRTGYTLLAEHGIERNIRKVLMGHQTGIDVSDLYDKRMQKRLADAVAVFDELLREHVPETRDGLA